MSPKNNLSDTILETKALTMHFGGLMALNSVSLKIQRLSITALIGPNGAGKTTLFNCLTGLYKPSGGQIIFNKSSRESLHLNGRAPYCVSRLGLARTFQNIRLFNNLTVLENVLIGGHCRLKSGLWGALFRGRKTKKEEKDILEYSHSLLKNYGLAREAGSLAKNLPYGAQRRLEIIRALAAGPSILLLDEPAAGLNLAETKELEEIIEKVRDLEKLTIILIEHDMSLVMSISHQIHVLDYGRLIASGPPEAIRCDPQVIRAYLGAAAS
ncbi:MAG: ABC transporter ATP-binding protein [Deltaproteobacteria bacterium]|jgi:branched-chain amino acid transport system ATP-binding protein|nr:ABC transporter ATP-binding protein [Deltaproteobacteria bacterium]